MRDTVLGAYQITDALAAGGMAEIYLARKSGPGGFSKRVVVKRITQKLLGDREIASMFLDEARIQALLDHPNIVQIYDFGEDGGDYYIAMEFVAGATLRWVIDNAAAVRRPVPIHHGLRIVADLLAGLHFAHERHDDEGKPLDLIHRDISPVNVLVARHGMAKLCDFGVAKSQIQRQRTRVGIVKGKFRYMSPEQLSGLPLDRRSDLFAVGACLWEILAGRRLFDQEREEDAVDAIRSGDYPHVTSFRDDVPPEIERMLARALQINPERRFRSAREFQLACEEVLRHLPRSSNSVLLGEYVSAELDGTMTQVPHRKAARQDVGQQAWLESGFAVLDPPVPQHPTRVTRTEQNPFDDAMDTRPPPSPLGRMASLALLAPAGVVAGVAKVAETVNAVFSKKRRPQSVEVMRTSSHDVD